MRFAHSSASCFDFTCQIQNPATSSLVSAKGPSRTVRLLPEYVMRAPFELAWRPSPASMTPASESLLAFTITMKRIAVSLSVLGSGLVRLRSSRRRTDPGEIDTGESHCGSPTYGLDSRLHCEGRYVQKHQDAGELRAAGNRRRDSRFGAAIRAQAQRHDAPVACQ